MRSRDVNPSRASYAWFETAPSREPRVQKEAAGMRMLAWMARTARRLQAKPVQMTRRARL